MQTNVILFFSPCSIVLKIYVKSCCVCVCICDPKSSLHTHTHWHILSAIFFADILYIGHTTCINVDDRARSVLSYIPWPCTKIDLPCVLRRRRAGRTVAHNTIASQSTITMPVQNTLYLPTTSKRMFSCVAYKRNFQSFLNDRKRAFVCECVCNANDVHIYERAHHGTCARMKSNPCEGDDDDDDVNTHAACNDCRLFSIKLRVQAMQKDMGCARKFKWYKFTAYGAIDLMYARQQPSHLGLDATAQNYLFYRIDFIFL